MYKIIDKIKRCFMLKMSQEIKTELSVNKELTQIFEELVAYYNLDKDTYRSKTFSNAITFLRKHPYTIISGEDFVKEYKGIGKKVALIIDEYLETGSVQRLEDLRNKHPGIYKLQKENTIFGIGPATIIKLYNKGVRHIDDLKQDKYYNNLTHAQQLGVDYMDDLQQKIPKEEMDDINDIFEEIFQDYPYEWTIVGSYRRKEPYSSDIDVLFKVNSDTHYATPKDIVNILKDNGVIAGDLALGDKKYMGILQIDQGTARRIDILVIPEESYAFALLYFTGSQRFNILMRSRALDLGLSLNEYGLSDEVAYTEKDIFEILGVKYIPPSKRTRNLKKLQLLN